MLLAPLTLAAMVIVALIAFLPMIPGPILVWMLGVVYVLLDQFETWSVLGFGAFSVLMLVGMTTGIWMPLLGMKADGVSCWGTLGMLVGGVAGTFLLPVPICGTLIGAILGALAFELLHARSIDTALASGQAAMKLFFLEMIANIIITVLMVAVFAVGVF